MTKEDVLSLLEHADAPVSGEQISRTLGVTRAAVWKAINQLRQEGYAIEAASRRGYRLTASPDRLNRAVIAGDTGAAVYVSHLDLMRTMQRALRRANVPMCYSNGFNPHPILSDD